MIFIQVYAFCTILTHIVLLIMFDAIFDRDESANSARAAYLAGFFWPIVIIVGPAIKYIDWRNEKLKSDIHEFIDMMHSLKENDEVREYILDLDESMLKNVIKAYRKDAHKVPESVLLMVREELINRATEKALCK